MKVLSALWKYLREGKGTPPEREPRMYVLVRGDLSVGLQAAQAIHAAAYLAASNPLKLYQHPTVTVLSVVDRSELCRYRGLFQDRNPEAVMQQNSFMFFEPDLKDEATAFACYSIGEEFAELPLMGKDHLRIRPGDKHGASGDQIWYGKPATGRFYACPPRRPWSDDRGDFM